jgi:RNA polymerase sigma-32 factor
MSSINAMALPVPVGSLESYVQAVNRFPILSLEEEQQLARKFRSEDDVEAARRLVLSHLRVVVAIARGYTGYGLPQGDLIQEGNIGLMKAVRRFDPERGVRLVSFAIHWIRAEIHEFVLRNWRMVKIATTKAQRKLFFNLRSMKPTLNPLTRTEIRAIAKELRVKPEEVSAMETRLAGQEVALEPAGDEDDTYAPIAYLADRSPEPPEMLEAKQEETLKARGLETALASLDARSRRIIEARWLREEKDSLTLHELADEFKVSAERIRQIEEKALAKMKGTMAPA